MERLSLHVVPGCSVDRFLRLEASLLAAGAPALLVAGLAGDAIVLGRHQRAASALELSRTKLPMLRRLSGGRAVRAGEGALGVALVVPSLGAGQPAPVTADKGLNRYVRPLLRGLTRVAPAPALWFGRDFVSLEGRRIAVVGEEASEGGALLFESLVALSQALELPPGAGGYPEHGDPRAAGPADGAIGEIRLSALAEALSQAHAEALGWEVAPADPPAEGTAPGAAEDEAGFETSGVADVPIGFAEALVRRAGSSLAEVRLRGDFLAPSFVMAGLERELASAPLDFAEMGRRVDAAFHRPGAFLHGVTRLRVFADAVLAAAG